MSNRATAEIALDSISPDGIRLIYAFSLLVNHKK